MNENGKKPQLCFKLLNFILYPKNKSKSNRSKNKNIDLKINGKNLKAITLLIPEKIFFECRLKDSNAAAFYPTIAIFRALDSIFDLYGYGDRFRFDAIDDGDSAYFQLRLFFKVNFHIIFCLVFQIIRIKIGRK